MKEKYAIQEKQYDFPYHYLPHFDNGSVGKTYRSLYWGFKYLCYLKHISKTIEDSTPKSVLDIGCGEGRLLNNLSAQIPRKLGVDTSAKAIAFAKAFATDADFIACSASDLNEQFDFVVAMEVLEHIPDEEVTDFLKTVEARTQPGGTVVISVPSVVMPLQEKHYRHYTKGLFSKQLAEAGVSLELLDVTYVYKPTFITKAYTALFNNRLWFVDVFMLNKLVWRHIEKNALYADEHTGHDCVFTLKKP